VVLVLKLSGLLLFFVYFHMWPIEAIAILLNIGLMVAGMHRSKYADGYCDINIRAGRSDMHRNKAAKHRPALWVCSAGQYAELRIGQIAFLPKHKRFAFVAERLDRQSVPPVRKSTGVHFEGVTQARQQNIVPNQSNQTLHLLAVTFTPAVAPAGQVTLHCTQGQLIKLDVEFLEAALADLPDDSKEI
jgi:hypothetical protein